MRHGSVEELRLDKHLLMSYVAMLYAPVSELISVVQQILPAKVGIRRVFEVLDTAPEVEDDPDGLKEPLRGDASLTTCPSHMSEETAS